MSFLAQVWLAIAGAISTLVVALHFLSRQRPRILLLPTARFIPDRPATAAAPASRPTDLLLLLLRVLVIMLLGAAFARPVAAPGKPIARMVLLDRSRAAAPNHPAIETAIQNADLVIPFDSAGHGSLSAALLAALRAAPGMAQRSDSIELVIVSPFATEEWDAATLRIRREWRGHIEPTLIPPMDSGATASSVRLVRTAPTPGDSAWARAGGTLVIWPLDSLGSTWRKGERDTVGGVLAAKQAVVAPFYRGSSPPDGELVAAWADGKPAATEIRVGSGCIRSVAIEIPETGDFPLRPAMLALVRELQTPCAGARRFERVADVRLDSLRGPATMLSSRSVRAEPATRVPANSWLLLASALLFATEPLVRRRSRSP